jgi:hypothetical protein
MARVSDDWVILLHGPYKAPRLRRGDRIFRPANLVLLTGFIVTFVGKVEI